MRIATRFHLVHELVAVESTIFGPSGRRNATLIVDTAAVMTTVTPQIAESVGYSAALRKEWSVIRSAVAEERGYTVSMLVDSVGFTMQHDVMVAELGYGIEGLLGMNFLRNFNVEFRFLERQIIVED